MNLYLDASALAKRYMDEEGRNDVNRAMRGADQWTSCRLCFVETIRAVDSGAKDKVKDARRDWSSFEVVEIDQPLCERAVALAGKHRLRSLDAIHLAAVLSISEGPLTFATWDRRLHAAATAEGLATLPESLA